jgi:triacylglycerol lipase
MINLSTEPNSTQFSLTNAYALAFASKLAYQSKEEIYIKLLEQHFNTEFIKEASTDTQLFIAHNGSAIVIAFRGHEKFKDWLTNAGIDFRDTSYGLVHKGFDQALDSVWSQITATLEKIQQYGQPLWINGHSLGGALAVLGVMSAPI